MPGAPGIASLRARCHSVRIPSPGAAREWSAGATSTARRDRRTWRLGGTEERGVSARGWADINNGNKDNKGTMCRVILSGCPIDYRTHPYPYLQVSRQGTRWKC